MLPTDVVFSRYFSLRLAAIRGVPAQAVVTTRLEPAEFVTLSSATRLLRVDRVRLSGRLAPYRQVNGSDSVESATS